MARALELAARGLYGADPNPRVGCVIARDGEVVGEGWHARAGEPHAEAHALAAAGERARGATAWVTLEPCCHHGRTPPCTDALVRAGIARVVYGADDPNPKAGGGAKALREAGLEVTGGVLAAASEALNRGFFTRIRNGRPWVRSKLAVSLDGRTALANGESRWITGAAARGDVHRWRARSSAILTGVGTVLADDPRLSVRIPELPEPRQPLRVVLDSSLRTPPEARLFAEPGPVLVVAAADDRGRRRALEARGARVEVLESGPSVDIRNLLALLAALEVNELWVEAGETLNGGLVTADAIDELVVYQAAHVLGSGARGMFALPDLPDMSARRPYRLLDVRRVGEDLRLMYGRAED